MMMNATMIRSRQPPPTPAINAIVVGSNVSWRSLLAPAGAADGESAVNSAAAAAVAAVELDGDCDEGSGLE